MNRPTAEMSALDLQQFCSTEATRFNLNKPWSADGYTYATNGHIAVRVPQRADVPGNDKAPNAQRVLDACADQSVSPLTLKLPRERVETCLECDGSNDRVHSCPSCDCVCAACDGRGEVSSDKEATIDIRGTPFALGYARMISRLPGLCFSDKPPHDVVDASKCPPSRFTFDGGEGCLMPVRRAAARHIEEETAS
jgi:hypothetical protein